MKIGGKYNWKSQPERLMYLGKKGYWHQFAKVETPDIVWCEVLDDELSSLEETRDESQAQNPKANGDTLT